MKTDKTADCSGICRLYAPSSKLPEPDIKKAYRTKCERHIKGRLLDECKALLLQTSWTLEQISYAVGFSDQPNFNFFFKKNTGFTPSAFRKGILQ